MPGPSSPAYVATGVPAAQLGGQQIDFFSSAPACRRAAWPARTQRRAAGVHQQPVQQRWLTGVGATGVHPTLVPSTAASSAVPATDLLR